MQKKYPPTPLPESQPLVIGVDVGRSNTNISKVLAYQFSALYPKTGFRMDRLQTRAHVRGSEADYVVDTSGFDRFAGTRTIFHPLANATFRPPSEQVESATIFQQFIQSALEATPRARTLAIFADLCTENADTLSDLGDKIAERKINLIVFNLSDPGSQEGQNTTSRILALTSAAKGYTTRWCNVTDPVIRDGLRIARAVTLDAQAEAFPNRNDWTQLGKTTLREVVAHFKIA